jgi:hypothetical protein
MNKVKIGLYILLTLCSIGFGRAFYKEYTANTKTGIYRFSAELSNEVDTAVATTTTPTPTPVIPPVVSNSPTQTNSLSVTTTNLSSEATNIVTLVTNLDGTILTNVVTNAVSSTTTITTNAVAATDTNVAAVVSNPAPAVVKNVPKLSDRTVPGVPGENSSKRHFGRMIAYLGAFLLSTIFLGLMIAQDVSQTLGSKSVQFLFNDEGDGMRAPEYEDAEAKWANGDYLEAVQLMRDYYKSNPSEIYVALRIAEIYEKDLQNFLAATLEYEAILEHRIPDERWGWAAIHLCNLYFKQNKVEKAVDLLRRIVRDYGHTSASHKARKRLALYDPEAAAVAPPEAAPVEEVEAPEIKLAKPGKKKSVKDDSNSNLPPGFRPKG